MDKRLNSEDNNIFISHFGSLTEDDLRPYFERIGQIDCLKIMRDKDTRQSKDIAFLHYRDESNNIIAIQQLNETKIGDYQIHVEVAIPKPRPKYHKSFDSSSWKPRENFLINSEMESFKFDVDHLDLILNTRSQTFPVSKKLEALDRVIEWAEKKRKRKLDKY